jgi:hypothetical protein
LVVVFLFFCVCNNNEIISTRLNARQFDMGLIKEARKVRVRARAFVCVWARGGSFASAHGCGIRRFVLSGADRED